MRPQKNNLPNDSTIEMSFARSQGILPLAPVLLPKRLQLISQSGLQVWLRMHPVSSSFSFVYYGRK